MESLEKYFLNFSKLDHNIINNLHLESLLNVQGNNTFLMVRSNSRCESQNVSSLDNPIDNTHLCLTGLEPMTYRHAFGNHQAFSGEEHVDLRIPTRG